jgi:hypothetical protein
MLLSELKKDLDLTITKIEEPIPLETYRETAKKFQILVEGIIESIWKEHNNKISMRLNNIPICLKGSSVNTSTAFGYVVEEFLVRQFPSYLKRTLHSTINSAEDVIYSDNTKIELMANLKVEKNTSSNSGIVAGNILQQRYLSNTKPKLYLVVKSKYYIDENESYLLFNGIESYYLESFITDPLCLNSDNRNWSEEYNVLSGRIKSPNKTVLEEKNINTIPDYNKVHSFMQNLRGSLTEVKHN